MQLLAKFKKILYMEFRATLNFRKSKSWKVLETVLSHLNLKKKNTEVARSVDATLSLAKEINILIGKKKMES